jgi:hypothetical protein
MKDADAKGDPGCWEKKGGLKLLNKRKRRNFLCSSDLGRIKFPRSIPPLFDQFKVPILLVLQRWLERSVLLARLHQIGKGRLTCGMQTVDGQRLKSHLN